MKNRTNTYDMKKQLLFITLIFVALLNVTFGSFAAEPDKEISITRNSNWNLEKLKISTNGELTFNDNYTDIIEVSDDGYLKISMVSFGMKRKLYVSSDEGRVVYRYFEGSKEISFEPKGREWMKEILPDVIRNSGIDLENRVNKMYQKKGVTAIVFDEFFKTYKKKGVEKLIITPELEDNKDIQLIWKNFNPIYYKKRCTMRKHIVQD